MDTGQLYQQRLARYVTALRNKKPGQILIRRIWNDIEALANTCIWQVLLSC